MRVNTNRLPRERRPALDALKRAALEAASDPLWTGDLTPAAIQQLADDFEALLNELQSMELLLGVKQTETELKFAEVKATLKRVDLISTAIHGEDSLAKLAYGFRPIDRTRNRPPAPDAIRGLVLSDGDQPGVLSLKWKRQPRATYLVEWAHDETFGERLGSRVTTRSSTTIDGTVGLKLFARVRPMRGGREGEWSDPVSRYVN